MSLQTPLMAMRVKTDIFAGSIALIANDGIAQRSAADSFKLQSTTYGGGGSPSRAGCTDVYIDPPARRVAALNGQFFDCEIVSNCETRHLTPTV